MSNKTNKIGLIAGSMLASLAIGTQATAADQFSFNTLGSGSELRADLLAKANPFAYGEIDTDKYTELKCGEGKCGSKDSTATDKKAKEGKCGKKKKGDKKAKESKCGGGC